METFPIPATTAETVNTTHPAAFESQKEEEPMTGVMGDPFVDVIRLVARQEAIKVLQEYGLIPTDDRV